MSVSSHPYTAVSGIMPDGAVLPLICSDDHTYAAFKDLEFRDYVLYGLQHDLPIEGHHGWLTCWNNLNALRWTLPGIEIRDIQTGAATENDLSKFDIMAGWLKEDYNED